MKFLFSLLLSVGLVWGIEPQPDPIPEKDVKTQRESKVVEVRILMNEDADNPTNFDPKFFDGLGPKHDAVSTTTVTPVTRSSVPVDLSQRLYYANYEDSQFDQKTLDLSGLDLSGEDVMKVLYSLNSTVLARLVRLDLSHNRVWDLPARIWPLELEYSLRELRLDYNRLNVAEPTYARTTRFELSRLISLQKLSMSHCGLTSTLDSMEFPPIKSLDLSSNRLVSLPSSLATLSTLQHLDVSGNHLRYLSGSPLASLTGLQTLNLSHNGLERMWDNPLEELYSLETLRLDHNALSEPPKLYHFTGSYQPRMEVYMSGNPFKCGCSFRNTLDIERLQIVDKCNVTCVDSDGVEWSVDTATANGCSPHLEAMSQKWSGAKEWFQDNRPDWSTLYRSLGWVLFGLTLGIIYAHRRAKKTPPVSQVPYNILDDRAVC